MDLAGLIKILIGPINTVILVLANAALVVFLWGGVRFIARSGSAEGRGSDKELLMWGLVALFVLFSMWGIINVLSNTLLPNTSSSVSAPASFPTTVSI